MYVPSQWGHAVLNLQPSVGVSGQMGDCVMGMDFDVDSNQLCDSLNWLGLDSVDGAANQEDQERAFEQYQREQRQGRRHEL